MCRRIIIDCEWDDHETEEAAGHLFDQSTNYMTLTDSAENILVKELTGLFDGQLTFEVRRLNDEV